MHVLGAGGAEDIDGTRSVETPVRVPKL
jgi:hypothetical protein